MKLVERRPFTNPDLAARKLVEIANGEIGPPTQIPNSFDLHQHLPSAFAA